ncbi:hypothetical protein M422DRAFT_238976 [Sphaerobolus stellatus SS14]|uniref:HNH nuclease domain-containing protein n=1 Tax=Sphaerobolus stellatus (strain SS14) TaxID=990650 RepID=A0A0C9UQF8_SPHS4|nr:hypothetical protein M422DRAFT_271129 [Sphaerobolus stellatus SS14]KIJ57382.1 hypothetical protein M422DRAFT_238976 [Sphaerobolus stellatus SS14]
MSQATLIPRKAKSTDQLDLQANSNEDTHMLSPLEVATPRPPPPAEHVHLVLHTKVDGTQFYLEIPVSLITANCLKPLKYLKYLGWCILAIEGVLRLERNNHAAEEVQDLNGQLLETTYFYSLPNNVTVDLNVIKGRTGSTSSESSESRTQFRKDLLARDGRCIFTQFPGGDAVHIIPYARGDQWLQLLINNRPHEDEDDMDDLKSICDIRNGFILTGSVHKSGFDPRLAAILKTPNRILQMADIPPRHHRRHVLAPNTCYPSDARFTYQWLDYGMMTDPAVAHFTPNNNDATFLIETEPAGLPKPSDLLLHYNYGAAAVKRWGRNTIILQETARARRPPQPMPASIHPGYKKSDRTVAIEKRVRARGERPNEGAGPSGAQGGGNR